MRTSLFTPLRKLGSRRARISFRTGRRRWTLSFATGRYATRPLSQRPKVIILDLKLPKVSGLEVLRRLKADPRTRTIPVVVLSSSQEERDLIASYELGVNSYIVKPMEFDDFSKSAQMIGQYWLQFNHPP